MAMKRSEIPIHASTHVDIENLVLSQISQTQKD